MFGSERGGRWPFLVLALVCVASPGIAQVAERQKTPGTDKAVSQSESASVVRVSGYAREMPPGAVMGAAYLTLENSAARERSLQKIEVLHEPGARVDLHTTVEVDGVSRMRPLAALDLPQSATLEMRPGATHLMLHGLQLKAGESLALRLRFADGEVLDVSIPVRSPLDGHEHHHHQG